MESEQSKITIFMFPWLAYSHVFPFLELAKRLSDSNFHIYFCSSAINLEMIKTTFQKDKSSNPSIELVELQLPSLPELPPELHTTKNLPPNLLPILLQSFKMSKSSISEILSSLKPDLLIYDYFQPWAPKIATLQNIPSVYFATSGAAPFSYFYHQHTHGSFSTYPYPELYLQDYEKPDIPAVREWIGDTEEELGYGVFEQSHEIVLMKSLKCIEGKYLGYLSELSHKKMIATGPLIHEASKYVDDRCSDIINWLSKKDQYSTLFICFGSENCLSMDQVSEMAKGLETCDVNFIWVIRFPADEKIVCVEDGLPKGFLDRVKGRGIVVEGWASQDMILAHPGIGGFVSHCGWSSTIESLYYGVPIIALPIKYDQPINARLLVDAGVGVEICKDEKGHFTGEGVAKAINKVFKDKTNVESMRQKGRNLSEKMKDEEVLAVNKVSEHLLRICMKNKLH